MGVVHFFEAFRKAKYRIFKMASSVGNACRFLMTFRSDRFREVALIPGQV